MNARKIVMLSIATVPFLFVPSAFAQQIVAAGSTVKILCDQTYPREICARVQTPEGPTMIIRGRFIGLEILDDAPSPPGGNTIYTPCEPEWQEYSTAHVFAYFPDGSGKGWTRVRVCIPQSMEGELRLTILPETQEYDSYEEWEDATQR